MQQLSDSLDRMIGALAEAVEVPDTPGVDRWHVRPVGGGANNRLYRATGPDGDFAIKLTKRDERDRAGREYEALRVLSEADPSLAPKPVYLCPSAVSRGRSP